MRKIQVLLLALVAVFAFSVFAVSISSAATEVQWLLNGEPITEPAAVDMEDKGGIFLTDDKGGLFGEAVTVECKGTGKGTVGPKAVDKVETAVCTTPKTIKGTCPSPKVTAIDLPWATKLLNTMEDTLESGTGGNPGWEVECTGVKDKCTGLAAVLVTNLTAAESGNPHADVDVEFTAAEAKTKPYTCERGGTGTGLIEGKVLVLDPNGNLSVSSSAPAMPPQWLLNGQPVAVAAAVDMEDKGGIFLTDDKGGLFGESVTIECKGTGTGTVGPKAVDKVETAVCTTPKTIKGTCPSPKVTAIDLPWATKLLNTMEDTLESGTGGNPGWEVECTGVKDKCTSLAAVLVTNLTAAESGNPHADVDVEFTAAEAKAKPGTCERGGAGTALVEGKVLVLDPNGDLSVSAS